jgi:hypothetical protein
MVLTEPCVAGDSTFRNLAVQQRTPAIFPFLAGRGI